MTHNPVNICVDIFNVNSLIKWRICYEFYNVGQKNTVCKYEYTLTAADKQVFYKPFPIYKH